MLPRARVLAWVFAPDLTGPVCHSSLCPQGLAQGGQQSLENNECGTVVKVHGWETRRGSGDWAGEPGAD